MEEGKNLSSLFEENGYIIRNVSTFAKEADNVDLNELISKLNGLEKQINAGIDMNSFAKQMKNSVEGIRKIIYGDDYFLKSASRGDFEAGLDLVSEPFKLIQNLATAEEIMTFQKKNMYDAMRQIYELDKKKDLDDTKRTSEALRLFENKKKCETSYRESLNFYYDQKKAYEESIKDFNIIPFKNNLLGRINSLETEAKKLMLAPGIKEKLLSAIADTRNIIAYFGLENMKSKTEFEQLCEKYGIESIGKKTDILSSNAVEEKVEGVERTEIPVLENEELAKVEPKKEEDLDKTLESTLKPEEEKVVISNQNQLIDELIKLNNTADKEVIRKVTRENDEGSYIEIIDRKTDFSNLKLPGGFSYSEDLGINNKVSDDLPYISVDVAKKRNILDKLTKKDGRIPSGKHKVVKNRKARLAAYAKMIILFGAIGGVAAIPASAAIIPVALKSGLLAGIGQAIHNKLVEKPERVPEFQTEKYREDPGTSPWAVTLLAKMHQGKEKLMEKYKERKLAKAAQKELEQPDMEEVFNQPVEDNIPEVEKEVDEYMASLNEALDGLNDLEEDMDNSLGGRI